MKKIFVTGGHYTPAQAVIEELIKRGEWKIYYLGRRYAMEGDKAEALEYQELNKIPEVTYLVIQAGRIQPQFFINVGQSILAFLKIFVGFGQTLYWILRHRPKIILSFGGYIAVPIVFWAFLLRIKIITHEQTVTSGLANKFISVLATKVLVSWPQSLPDFPLHKAILTGNPMRYEILAEIGKKPPHNFPPLIFVTGGNQGAHVINLAIEKNLEFLVSKYQIVHQTGDSSFHDFDRLIKLAGKNYRPIKFLGASDMAKALFNADLIISRSGANITTEILALEKKSILIPIPWSKNDEQLKNAQMLKDQGLGEIVLQNELNRLPEVIDLMADRPAKPMTGIILNAAAKITDVLTHET